MSSTDNVSDSRIRAKKREEERQKAREERKAQAAASRATRTGSEETEDTPDDPNDPLAAERRKWQERQRAKAAAAGGSEGSHANTEEDQMIMHAKQLQKENASTLKNTIKVARETTTVGASTIHKLDEQTEQFERMDQALDETNDSLTRSERILRGMKSFGGALTNFFSSADKDKAKKKGEKTPGTSTSGMSDLEEKDRARQAQHEAEEDARRNGISSSPSSSSSRAKARNADKMGDLTNGRSNTGVQPNSKQSSAIQQLEANQREEDEALDELSDVLGVLKEQSNVINQQLTKQDKLLDTIGDKVDTTSDRLKKGSRTMQKIS